VRWTEGGTACTLSQETRYPFENNVTMKTSVSQPVETTIYVRIPAWAAPDPVLSVNGKRVTERIDPGTFAAIRRTWRDGDRIELELPMPLRLEPVDVQHSNEVALLCGPLVLFAITDSQPAFDKAELLRTKAVPGTSGDWSAVGAGKNLVMRPFMNIKEESYITYLLLKA
jgi:DUF1680 family protein